MATTTAPPAVLIAVVRDHSLAKVLDEHGYSVVQPPTATLALEWARDIRPDVVILDTDLPDMSGSDACWLFRSDPHVGRNVPILILAAQQPTPEQRVTALRAGAWDFLRYPSEGGELTLKLQTYVQAKRNIDAALADGPIDPATGLHSRTGLARRARELGALMARTHGALACVVFAVDADAADVAAAAVVAQAARVSDVVGRLGPREFAVIAPATDHVGALHLARRVADTLSEEGSKTALTPGKTLHVGYEAVTNLKYSPIDPVALLARATAAVRDGKPEADAPWLRRFDLGAAPKPAGPPRISAPGLVSDTRSVSP
ncbi:MAG TPA: response regulator [Gemmatimonadales bacterium]